MKTLDKYFVGNKSSSILTCQEVVPDSPSNQGGHEPFRDRQA